MLITNQEIQEKGIDLKRWAANMQVAARSPFSPVFTLAGPCILDVRERRTSQSVRRSFVGGEQFRVSGVFTQYNDRTDSYLISAALSPFTAALAAEISGVTLTLAECINLLDCFEEWAEEHQSDAVGIKPMLVKKTSLADERIANAAWGTW